MNECNLWSALMWPSPGRSQLWQRPGWSDKENKKIKITYML